MKTRFIRLAALAAFLGLAPTAFAQSYNDPSTAYQGSTARVSDQTVPSPSPNNGIRTASNSSNLSFLSGGSILDELGDLSAQVEANSEALADLEGDIGGKVSDGTSNSTMKISGRVHADYWAFPESSPASNAFETGSPTQTPQDRFGFRRLRFGVKGDINDNMEYKIEMEFASPSNLAFKDAYLGFNDLPFLQTLLIGNQKRPYGLDHLNSSRYNVFMERPYVIEAYNQDARRLGICSYGLSDDLRYNWRFGVFNQEDTSKSGSYVGDAYQSELAGRFANTIWYDEASGGRGYAHWAVSGSFADPDGSTNTTARFRTRPEARSSNRWIDTKGILGTEDYTLVGLEGVVNLGPLQVVGEYQATSLSRGTGYNDTLQFDGGYMYVSYFLTGEHMPWERKSGTLGRIKPFENFWRVRDCDGCVQRGLGAWQVAARYSYADFTDEDILGGVGSSFTAGLNWYWNPNARMQFNYIYGTIDERSVAGQTGGDYQIIGTRFMVDF